MTLDYIYHSGFAIEMEGVTVIIDYYKDSSETEHNRGIVHDYLLQRPGKLYVLATHFHPDHFNREILTWKKQRPDIQYIFSKDILKSHRAKAEDAFYIKKGETYEDETIRIDAFGSTDVGSSFLLHLQDWSIFHAGDLNNWHWSEESTEEEIRKANGDFLAEVKYLKEKAAKQFIEQIKTTIFVPMHFSEDYEGGNALRSFAENAGCRFISITHRGESFEITK